MTPVDAQRFDSLPEDIKAAVPARLVGRVWYMTLNTMSLDLTTDVLAFDTLRKIVAHPRFLGIRCNEGYLTLTFRSQ